MWIFADIQLYRKHLYRMHTAARKLLFCRSLNPQNMPAIIMAYFVHNHIFLFINGIISTISEQSDIQLRKLS